MSYFLDNDNQQSQLSTKDKILKWKADIDKAKAKEFKPILAKKDDISKEITKLFQRIQHKDYQDIQEYEAIGQRIDQLNDQSKTLTKTYDKIMAQRFKELKERYPSIFDMLVNGQVDPQTLKHVLNTFDQVEKGNIDKNEGTSRGLDFVTDKFNLPKDFFNKDAIGKK